MRNCLNIVYYTVGWKKPSMVFCETLNTECNEVIVIELLQIYPNSSMERIGNYEFSDKGSTPFWDAIHHFVA